MSILNSITSLGFSSIFAALIYVGKKLQMLDDLQAATGKLKTDLKIVCDHLTIDSANFNHRELQAYSPLQLSPPGQHLVEQLGFDAVFYRHKQDFLSYIDGESPSLKYDVEAAAIRSIIAFHSKRYMAFLKIFFYNHPDRNLSNLAPTLGIYVRDRYLSAHPEITE